VLFEIIESTRAMRRLKVQGYYKRALDEVTCRREVEGLGGAGRPAAKPMIAAAQRRHHTAQRLWGYNAFPGGDLTCYQFDEATGMAEGSVIGRLRNYVVAET
jgi:hypothetical protein